MLVSRRLHVWSVESHTSQREMGHASCDAWHVLQILEHRLLWRYVVVDLCTKRGEVLRCFRGVRQANGFLLAQGGPLEGRD
jgi:hypothetical protein